jgi:hypothetical protein
MTVDLYFFARDGCNTTISAGEIVLTGDRQWRADAESKPWTMQSLVLDDAKSSPGRRKVSSDAKSNSSRHFSVWCSQGIVPVVLRDLGAQANSGWQLLNRSIPGCRSLAYSLRGICWRRQWPEDVCT